MTNRPPKPSPEPSPELKSERVQRQMESLGRLEKRLKSERVQAPMTRDSVEERLRELPGWTAVEGALERTFIFPTPRAAALFASLVVEIGTATDYLPEIDIRYLEVTLRVATHTEAGITALDFDVARLLDLRI